MDILDIIQQRKSVRNFTKKMPPRKLILECLEAASWAPNPTSQQPWKFIVLTGSTLKKASEAIQGNYQGIVAKKVEDPAPAFAGEMADVLACRKQENFREMMGFLTKKGARLKDLGEGNFNFHRAPLGIIFATYPCKDLNFFKSTIAAMENFFLAATDRGLGTCWINAVSICEAPIKEALKISPELILVDGIAVGYPVKNAVINQVPRNRLPVKDVTEWR